MNPQWSLTGILSPRITFNQDDSSVGSDTIYRLVSAGYATYSFNDNFNLYGAATGDQRSVDISRGALGAEKGNALIPELGANLTVGKITINPSLTSEVSLADSTASIGTASSRIFASENTSYNLNLYATF
jgi:hypothetical protein